MQNVASAAATVAPGTVSQGVKRVRTYSDGHLVADAPAPLLVWEHPYYPQYGFAPDEVEVDLKEAGPGPRSKVFGRSELFDVVVDGVAVHRAATRYPDAPDAAMREAILISWNAMTTWLEEDEVVHFHARSPYVRVDVLPSSRHVEVKVDGEVIADSRRASILFETGLAPRFYLPRVDVRMDRLVPTETTSNCPYKGTARYWSVRRDGQADLEDIVWGYDSPFREADGIAGLVCFWPEKSADLELFVDGQRVGQPG